MKIPLKYKVPLQGEYNPGIFYCPNTGCDFEKDFDNMNWFIGFTDEYIICECPKCFTKWHYHHRNSESKINCIIMCIEEPIKK